MIASGANDSNPNLKLQKYYVYVEHVKQFVERRINKNISSFFKTNPYLATSKIHKEKVLYQKYKNKEFYNEVYHKFKDIKSHARPSDQIGPAG